MLEKLLFHLFIHFRLRHINLTSPMDLYCPIYFYFYVSSLEANFQVASGLGSLYFYEACLPLPYGKFIHCSVLCGGSYLYTLPWRAAPGSSLCWEWGFMLPPGLPCSVGRAGHLFIYIRRLYYITVIVEGYYISSSMYIFFFPLYLSCYSFLILLFFSSVLFHSYYGGWVHIWLLLWIFISFFSNLFSTCSPLSVCPSPFPPTPSHQHWVTARGSE